MFDDPENFPQASPEDISEEAEANKEHKTELFERPMEGSEPENIKLWDPPSDYEDLVPLMKLVEKSDYEDLAKIRQWINQEMKKKHPDEENRFTPWALHKIEEGH